MFGGGSGTPVLMLFWRRLSLHLSGSFNGRNVGEDNIWVYDPSL